MGRLRVRFIHPATRLPVGPTSAPVNPACLSSPRVKDYICVSPSSGPKRFREGEQRCRALWAHAGHVPGSPGVRLNAARGRVRRARRGFGSLTDGPTPAATP